jgi:hypothetical protein
MSTLAKKLLRSTAAVDATRTHLGQTSSETDLSTYTFASQSLGTEQSDRKIVVAVMGRRISSGDTGLVPSTVTVGGVSATLAVSSASSGDRNSASIWIADVPTGATGDIVVTFSANQGRCGIGWWATYGLTSSTPTDTASTSTNGGALDIDISAGGLGFGYGNSGAGTATTHTWVGLTEDFDAAVGTGNGWHSGASLETATAATPLTVNCTGSGTPTNDQYVAASFR